MTRLWRTLFGTAAAALGVAVLIANSPWITPKRSPYDLRTLESARLKRLDGSQHFVRGRDLWREHGAIIMVEATRLSSLRPVLAKEGIPLYGILHEETGVEEFRPFLQGELLLDEEKVFYGPEEARMGLLGLFRISVIQSSWRAYRGGFSGNVEGDGTLLGGSLVVGPGEQGILFEYHSTEFGDRARHEDIVEAVSRIKND